MNQLETILKTKQLEERQEILVEELKDFEKELALWQSWLVLNEGNFTPSQVAGCLNRAKQIVNELLMTNENL
jgi:hypothetical protein